MSGVLEQKTASQTVVTVSLEMCPRAVQLIYMMLQLNVQWVSICKNNIIIHRYIYHYTECSTDEVQCRDGRIDRQNSSCITTEQRCDGIFDCVGGEDEYCTDVCSPEGAVQLVGGRGPHEGRVEFCKNGEWATICGKTSWDHADAVVICRQLGFPTESNRIHMINPT